VAVQGRLADLELRPDPTRSACGGRAQINTPTSLTRRNRGFAALLRAII
jgi:hypothetical protein